MAIEPNIETEAHKFSKYIFDEIIERVKAVGAPKKDYKLPEITFRDTITLEEKEELYALEIMITRIFTRVDPIIFSSIDEKNAIIRIKIGVQSYERYNYLIQKIESDDTKGFFDRDNKQIVLNTIGFKEGIDYGAITHEILHSIRSQILPYEEKNIGYTLLEIIANSHRLDDEPDYTSGLVVYISPQIMEFPAMLEKVVLISIGKDHNGNTFSKNEETSNITFDQLRKSHDIFLKGNFRKYISQLFEHYTNICVKFKEDMAFPLSSRIKTYKDDYNKFKEYCGHFSDKDHLAYLRLIAEISPMGLELIKNGIEALDERLNYLGRYPESDLHLDINFPIFMFNAAFKLRGVDDKEHCYLFNKLVITENQSELLWKWPSAVFFNGPDIEEIYFKPILRQLNQFYL